MSVRQKIMKRSGYSCKSGGSITLLFLINVLQYKIIIHVYNIFYNFKCILYKEVNYGK